MNVRGRIGALLVVMLVVGCSDGAGLDDRGAAAGDSKLASGPSFFVSPSGNDSSPGTEDQPFQTLERAKAAVRAINQGMTSDINVYLRGGTYALSSTVTFEAADSGTNGFNVIYGSYPSERAVLSGGAASCRG